MPVMISRVPEKLHLPQMWYVDVPWIYDIIAEVSFQVQIDDWVSLELSLNL